MCRSRWLLLAPFAIALAPPVIGAEGSGGWQHWILAQSPEFSGSVLIARGDAVEFAGAYGLADREAGVRNTVDTRFNLGSINKTFTAIAIAQLLGQGRLSLDDKLAKHLPDYPNAQAAAAITVGQLVTHRSGVATFMRADFGDAADVADMVELVGAAPQTFEPGARQDYSNGGYILLGRIVEVVSGMRYDEYVAKHIYEPAGMTDTGFVSQAAPDRGKGGPALALGYFAADAQGRPVMGGGAPGGPVSYHPPARGNPAGGGFSTARDLYAFARALRGGRLLDPRTTELVLHGTFSGQALPEKFGFALREQFVGARRFLGNGGGAPGVNAEFRFEAAGDATVVVLSNASPPAATRLLTAILERLAAPTASPQ